MRHEKYKEVLFTLEAAQDGLTMLGDFRERKYTPFRILISTILSARAKDEVTIPVSETLFEKYPDAQALAGAKVADVERIIKRIGFYRNKARFVIEASRMLLEDFKGRVPKTKEELERLPGVGSKVANCVLVYAFDVPAIPVDTHVHRIANRIGWVRTKTPEQTERRLEKLIPKKWWHIVNEVLVIHGQTVCSPISPHCSRCPIYDKCKRVGVRTRR